LIIAEPILLVAVFLALFFCAAFRVRNAALLTVAVALVSVLPFLLRFEIEKPRPAVIMPIVILSAIAAAGRILLNPLPNFQPVSALVIFSGLYFGRQSGYLTGAFTALVSNMVLGQGLWTPLQMCAWGLMGYGAGILGGSRLFESAHEKKEGSPVLEYDAQISRIPRSAFSWMRRAALYAYAICATGLYGLMMDTWFIVGFLADPGPATILKAYGAGLVMNFSHICSTILFLALTAEPWGSKVQRIRTKYGLKS
jgi:energy-coupling factor transport system substrate-specific component